MNRRVKSLLLKKLKDFATEERMIKKKMVQNSNLLWHLQNVQHPHRMLYLLTMYLQNINKTIMEQLQSSHWCVLIIEQTLVRSPCCRNACRKHVAKSRSHLLTWNRRKFTRYVATALILTTSSSATAWCCTAPALNAAGIF